MKQKRTPTQQTELDRLYSESGDAEPAAGLDRIVLARADQALGNARRTPRRPFLAGLATAAVALVSLAVVLQQTPTAPEPVGPFERTESGAVSQDRSISDAELSETDAARKAASETRLEFAAPAARSRGASFEAGLPESEPATSAPAEARTEPEASVGEAQLQSITVTGSRIVADQQGFENGQHSPHEPLFQQLRLLIADGKPDQARELLHAAEQRDGRIVLPEDLARVLGDESRDPAKP